jgi:hypothetical protein
MSTIICIAVCLALTAAFILYRFVILPKRLAAKAEAEKANAERLRLASLARTAKYLEAVEKFPDRYRDLISRCEELLSSREKNVTLIEAKNLFVLARNSFEHDCVAEADSYLRRANNALNAAEEYLRCAINRRQSEGLLK